MGVLNTVLVFAPVAAAAAAMDWRARRRRRVVRRAAGHDAHGHAAARSANAQIDVGGCGG